MARRRHGLLLRKLLATLWLAFCGMVAVAGAAEVRGYGEFHTAIYVTVGSVKELANPDQFARQYARVAHDLKFDKVYLEVYRNRVFATDAEINTVKDQFSARGIRVAGGITLATSGANGVFRTFDYEDAAERAECQRAVELAARHFNEVILDDFFFFNTRSDADIKAKGTRTWTEYRLDTMRKAARELVIGPARQINPDVRVIIKYPNWYEHYRGLGFDLDATARLFDGVYAGTETRDPQLTDQYLQQYQSYLMVRMLDNLDHPGGNGGGWVDTYWVDYVDRYAEQLWDTLLAKAPEITLFDWKDMASVQPSIRVGSRDAWQNLHTSFDWNELVKTYRPTGPHDPGPGWAFAADKALTDIDKVLAQLGKPVGVAAYRPVNAAGEEYLHGYLGNVGIPLELTTQFPQSADTVLLTQAASQDADILEKIKLHLAHGKRVIITSGFLRVMQARGIADIAEWQVADRKIEVTDFVSGDGPDNGELLADNASLSAKPDVLVFPDIYFFTNDSWALVRGDAGIPKGVPIVLASNYSAGRIYLLNIPDNPADMYRMPEAVWSRIKQILFGASGMRLESPALVSLMSYDNGAFVVRSSRDAMAEVTVVIKGNVAALHDLRSGSVIRSSAGRAVYGGVSPESRFKVRLMPHSWRAFRIEAMAR